MNTIGSQYLLNDVGAELLNRKRADVANELTNDCIAEPVVVKIEDVLNNLWEGAHQLADCSLAT